MAESSDSSSTVPAAASHAAMSRAEAAAIDAGLRAHMMHVYNYMALGLAVTAISAMGIYLLSVTDDPAAAAKTIRAGAVSPALARNLYLTPAGYALFVSPLKWVIILAPLILAFSLNFSIERMRPALAQLLFWFYAALIGISLGAVFMIYTHTSTARVFFITAASFSALSLFGYTTQRDLGGMGAFLTMGLCGIIIAGLVNFVLASSLLQWVISVTGIAVFSGLTAWDSQRLKNEYIYGAMDGDIAERTAILGALRLYLHFVNLFTLLLEVSGERDE
ncbi:MAG: Bax inhibitor-1/YccA family protein [Bradyrhizobiaceae bacterium]|nr:Bax inhibitor-1/YccA family protein [Bradyrhizobiaceae bacterium]